MPDVRLGKSGGPQRRVRSPGGTTGRRAGPLPDPTRPGVAGRTRRSWDGLAFPLNPLPGTADVPPVSSALEATSALGREALSPASTAPAEPCPGDLPSPGLRRAESRRLIPVPRRDVARACARAPTVAGVRRAGALRVGGVSGPGRGPGRESSGSGDARRVGLASDCVSTTLTDPSGSIRPERARQGGGNPTEVVTFQSEIDVFFVRIRAATHRCHRQ